MIHTIPGVSQTIGVEGIEMLLRELDPLANADSALLEVPAFPDVDIDIEELYNLKTVSGKPLSSRIPLIAWLRNLINNLGPRWYVDNAFAEQGAFNDAVVRALMAQRERNATQDRLNREQTAALILVALETLGRLADNSPPTENPPAEK